MAFYVKPMNEAFARHIIACHKQELGESLDLFLQLHKLLAKDCKFCVVTALEMHSSVD